ncbi:hypothetical protein KI616_15190 [Hydrogenophaga taeniospiralis]|nr:hypothetical protein [Hydrogenophaga taeniospiralis]UCU92208.1 hypothetical protein KI616_15190 [Hydrogenophaga taeniospiralis]
MSSATQRYFSFALGRKDQVALTKIFSVNLLIYVAICVLALAVLESAGLWFVHEALNIPKEHAEVAKLLYQISILTFISSLLASPFMSILIAHEEIDIFLYVSIYEAVAKLAAAITITFTSWEKLTTYGTAIFFASATTTLIYLIVCKKRYPACTFKCSMLDRATFKEILSFTGWTLFGQLTTVARNQAVTILLYQTFNPAVAAARAIATTVASQVTVFSNNLNTSLYPPIIKYYSTGQREEMFSVIIWGSKLTFFLMWVFALPLYLEMETVLQIWLATPPPKAVSFSQLALIEAVIMTISLPLATAARAPGRMRKYELALGTIQLLILVASWAMLSMGQPAESVFLVAIAANVLMFFIRLIIVSALIGLGVSLFLKKVALPVLLVAISSSVPVAIVKATLPSNHLSAGFVVLLSMLTSAALMFYLGFDATTRQRLKEQIKAKIPLQS